MRNGSSRQSEESLEELAATDEYSMRPLDAVDPPKTERSKNNLHGNADNGDEEEGVSLISNEGFRRRRVGNHLSSGEHSFPFSLFKAIVRWTQGPPPPRIYRIRSSEWHQIACDRLLDKCLPYWRLKLALLLLLYILWAGMFISALPIAVVSDIDPGIASPTRLSCTSQLW